MNRPDAANAVRATYEAEIVRHDETEIAEIWTAARAALEGKP